MAWLAVATLVSLLTRALGACELQLSQDFAGRGGVDQSYTNAMMQKDWPSPAGPFKRLGGETKISDGAIVGFFPRGQILAYNSGFSWYSLLPKPLSEATMEYDVYFSPGYDWTLGGKLPGLCGLDCPVGCSRVGQDRGWSTRLMWRKFGGMVTYAYYPDKPDGVRCGEDWGWSEGMTDGKWHKIRVYVKINTPGKPDGVARAYLDGKQVLDKTDVMYRYKDSDDFMVTRAYITTYVGGSDPARFAPDHDQYIKFDNFKVYEGDCGSETQTPTPTPAPEAAPTPAQTESWNGAPVHVGSGYTLFNGEGDWDLLQRKVIATARAPQGSDVATVARFCADSCDTTPKCARFTIYRNECYFREATDERPAKVGPNEVKNVIYLYTKEQR